MATQTASQVGTSVNGVKTVSIELPVNYPLMTKGLFPAKIDWEKMATKFFNGKTATIVNPTAPLDIEDAFQIETRSVPNIYQNVKNIPKDLKGIEVRGQNIYVKYDTSLVKNSLDVAGNSSRALLPIKISISATIPSDIDVTSDLGFRQALQVALGAFYSAPIDDASTMAKVDEYRRNAITQA